MGGPNAATVMDSLSAIGPKAALFLGKCGGLKKNQIGDLVLPIATRAPPTTTCCRKCRHCRRSSYSAACRR